MTVSANLPNISIIIPVAPNGDIGPVVTSLERLRYPQEKVEIIKSEGCQPSKQRNVAARMAEGEILGFFDNDSVVSAEIVSMALDVFRSSSVAVVGGPNLTPSGDSRFQRALGEALGSRFAHGKMAARYRAIGHIREAGEQELILCNMFVRRNVFLELGGFNEKLYPNEENEFLNRVKSYGSKIIYDPQMSIWRSRRRTLGEFIKQMFNYGRGRGEQLYLERFRSGGLSCLAPLAFTLYLVLFLPLPYGAVKLPLFLYLVLAFISALSSSLQNKRIYYLFLLPFLYFVMHISYGLGTAWGLLNGVRKSPHVDKRVDKVKVVKLKEFDASWIK